MPGDGFTYSFPIIFPDEAQSTTPATDLTPQSNVEQLAINRYAQYIKTKPNVIAITAAICAQYQDIENALQGIYFYRQLSNAYGQYLDDIGTIVGRPRDGLDDATYRLYLAAQIVADTASGTTEDFNKIFKLIVPAGVTFSVNWQVGLGGQGGAFEIYLTDPSGVLTADQIAAYLGFVQTVRAAGVKGMLNYSEGNDDSAYFTFDGGSGGTSPGLDQGLFRTTAE